MPNDDNPFIDDYLGTAPLPYKGKARLNGTVRPLVWPPVHDVPTLVDPVADQIDAAEVRGATIEALARAESADHVYNQAIDAAWKNGHSQGSYEGEKRGYARGTHWGMVVGTVGTVVAVALVTVGVTLLIGLSHRA